MKSNLKELAVMVIGVGSNGVEMIEHMDKEGLYSVEIVAIENPNDSYDDIKNTLKIVDIVFICIELGDESGKSIALIVTKAAKAVNALTITLLIQPSCTDDKDKAVFIEDELKKLSKQSDSVLLISKDIVLLDADDKFEIKPEYKVVIQTVKTVLGVLSGGKNDINIDLSDVRSVMKGRSKLIVGIGDGESPGYKAVKNVLKSPIVDRESIRTATSILVHFKIHTDCQLVWLSDAMQVIEDLANDDASIVYGTTSDDSLVQDQIIMTMIVSNERERLLPINKI